MKKKISVVIPCYKVSNFINEVLEKTIKYADIIYCIDDGCPDNFSKYIEKKFLINSKIKIISHSKNMGMGAAIKTGYFKAIKDGADIIIKIDGDNQMDPSLIPLLIKPLIEESADYTKGNRLVNLKSISNMPITRMIGNSFLSLLAKFSTGFWKLSDPENGFTAIHSKVLHFIDLQKLNDKFFFAADLLHHLNLIEAVVEDVPMFSIYGNEKSNNNIFIAFFTFPFLHLKNFIKRLFISYFVKNFSIASLFLLFGIFFLLGGSYFAIRKYYFNLANNIIASPGEVMLYALIILSGIFFVLNFLTFDYMNTSEKPLIKKIKI